MRRWDGLVDVYLEEYVARGVCTAMADNVRRELERWGNWMKRRRPRPKLEALEPQLLIRYIEQRLGITQALIEALVKDIANDFYRIKFTDTALVTETETLRIAYYLQSKMCTLSPAIHG